MGTSVNTKTYIFQNPNDPTILSEWRRVAFVENFFDILTDIHCKEKGHIGTKKTLAEVLYDNLTGHIHMYLYLLKMQVSKLYKCLPRSAVDKFV